MQNEPKNDYNTGVNGIAVFHNDTELFATCGDDGTLRIWNMAKK